jgi:hypothetical protein
MRVKKYLRGRYKRLKELYFFTLKYAYIAVIIALVLKYI